MWKSHCYVIPGNFVPLKALFPPDIIELSESEYLSHYVKLDMNALQKLERYLYFHGDRAEPVPLGSSSAAVCSVTNIWVGFPGSPSPSMIQHCWTEVLHQRKEIYFCSISKCSYNVVGSGSKSLLDFGSKHANSYELINSPSQCWTEFNLHGPQRICHTWNTGNKEWLTNS